MWICLWWGWLVSFPLEKIFRRMRIQINASKMPVHILASVLADPHSKEAFKLNPDFVLWQKKDQDLLSWLNATLSEVVWTLLFIHLIITSYSFATRDVKLSFDEFQTELLNYEMLITNHRHPSEQDAGSFALYSQKPKNKSYRKNKPVDAHRQNNLQTSSFYLSNLLP